MSDAASGARSFLPATRGLTLLTALARERTVEVMPYESRTEGNAHAGMHVREPLEPRRAEIEMIHLSREECLELLAVHRFGRLAVVMSNGAPVIRPINYVFDRSSQSVVFRTARGSKLHAVLQAAKAAFEIDGVDERAGTGWSVIIEGVTAEISRASDIGRLDGLRLQPWAPGPKPHWVRIRAWTVSGRRIVLPDEVAPGHYLG